MKKVRREKMQVREKVGKSRNPVFFPVFCGSGGSKSRLAKAAGGGDIWADEKVKIGSPLWRESTFGSQKCQNTPFSEPLLEVEMWQNVHAVVARSTFGSKKCQNTSAPERLLEVAMWKKVHAVVARSTFSSQKWQNTSGLGRLLEVELWKKCTPLWREAHLEVKSVQNTSASDDFWTMQLSKKCAPLWREAHFESKNVVKTHQVFRTTFGRSDVEKVHAVVARSTFGSKKCTKHTTFGTTFGRSDDHSMSKKCTPLGREAHFQVKSVKN